MKKEELATLAAGISTGLKDAISKFKVEVRKGAFEVSEGAQEEITPATDYGRILFKKSATCNQEEKEFRQWNDDCMLLGAILKRDGESLEHRVRTLKHFNRGLGIYRQRSELAKAMTTAASGAGAEWIPTNFSSEVVEIMRLELKVAALFMEVQMTSNPMKVPAISAKASAKLGVEATAPTATTVGTRQITLDAKKIITYIPYSDELEEDAAVAILPVLRQEMALSLADALEDATINGDTTSPHQDSDVVSAEDCRKAWKGLRKLCLPGSKLDLSTFTLDNLVALKKLMKKFGTQPGRLAMIVNYVSLSKLETLKDASNNPVFLNRQLPNDPWVQGAVGIAMGMPVLPSEFMRDDLNASGVYTGTPASYSQLIIVRKDGFLYGNRGTVKVEQERIVKSQSVDLVASQRKAFVDRLDAANNPIVACGNKIS